jgi:tetratricopeptide (TPR) repeat protein
MGCFLWHVEACAYKRSIPRPESKEIPEAEEELRQSLKAAESLSPDANPAVAHHRMLTYFFLGSYLITIRHNDLQSRQEAQQCLQEAVKLERAGIGIAQLISKNSYVESYLAQVFLLHGDRTRAKKMLRDAVERYHSNWRAWWLLGRVCEQDGEYKEACRCFATSAAGQNWPMLYGQLRVIVRDWVKQEKVSGPGWETLEYSRKVWELDPEGNLNPKNLSDYGYDLYLSAKKTRDKEILTKARRLLLLAADAYLHKGMTRQANFPFWYAGECEQLLAGNLNAAALDYYARSAELQASSKGYREFANKIIPAFTPRWNSGQCIPSSYVTKIQECVERHPELDEANLVLGVVLQRQANANGNNKADLGKALPYLERAKSLSDPRGLRSLMECYARLGKTQHAETVYLLLLARTPPLQKARLQRRISELGLSP